MVLKPWTTLKVFYTELSSFLKLKKPEQVRKAPETFLMRPAITHITCLKDRLTYQTSRCDVVCATDYVFVIHHGKLLEATVSLGTKVKFLPSLKRSFFAPSAVASRFVLAALIVYNRKPTSLTKTRCDVFISQGSINDFRLNLKFDAVI